MRVWLLLFALAACGDDGVVVHGTCRGPVPCTVDGSGGLGDLLCDPLTQTGCQATEKCTWIVDETAPTYVGHIGCVPDGTAAVGAACMYGAAGATGYDNCAKGGVCSAFAVPGTQGICKQVCDNQGGSPMCGSDQTCITYSKLFSTGATSPAAAGVCDPACDPLADNDFDGSAGPLMKGSNTCGSDFHIGCYGIPSRGTPPRTAFSCTGDINSDPDKGLRHRSECTTATGCADIDGTIYVNSCNQGYLPVMRESTANSTAMCIAMCKPMNCYAGNCGSNDVNRLGAVPHRCTMPDAVGNFGSGEECRYMWFNELDGSGHWLPSPYSDSVGFCYDHSQYFYDPSGGNNPTIPLPPCEQLQIHATGSDATMPLTYFGAVDFGCVDSTTAGLFTGKLPKPVLTGLRGPYHRAMR